MSTARLANPGKTRVCPHCRSEILASASVCPACRHHLRFGLAADQQAPKTFSALAVEGTLTHPGPTAWEYAVVVSVRNERGEETARQVVSVGALQPSEQRTFNVTVDVYTPDTEPPVKPVAQQKPGATQKPAPAAKSAPGAKPASTAKPTATGKPPTAKSDS